MGNRLVIHNNINGKRVNSLYYHWSADAISGVTELAKFLIAMYKVYNKADEQEVFIKQLNGKGKEFEEKLNGSEKLLTEDKELLFNLISYHVSAGACYEESKNFAKEHFNETHVGSPGLEPSALSVTMKTKSSIKQILVKSTGGLSSKMITTVLI